MALTWGRKWRQCALAGAVSILVACGGSSVDDAVLVAPVANDDTLSIAAGGSATVLSNDTLDGSAVSGAVVQASARDAWPAGILLGSDGLLSVGAAVAAGSYSLSYNLCLTADTSVCDSANVTLTVPVTGVVTGQALDAHTGAGVANVTVRVGAASTTTDATGAFSLAAVPVSERVSVVFEGGTTHATTSGIANLTSDGASVSVLMVPVGAVGTVDIAAGGTVTVPGSTAMVTLPANGVVRADGSVPTGSMTVRLTPIAPAVDTRQMPGDYATRVNGVLTPLESFGALNVTLTDANGAALNLASGKTATLRIALSTRSAAPPATVPLYYFDNDAGVWVEEGSATLGGSDAARYYEGSVSHFTTWNADQVYDRIFVYGCVSNAQGERVASAYVSSDGVDYSGSNSAYADANGNFMLGVRRSSITDVLASHNDQISNTLRTGPHAVDTSLMDNCLVLGQAAPIVTIRLTWGAEPADLNAYLLTPNEYLYYYENLGHFGDTFTSLDVDVKSGYGPEVITISRLMVGTYKYAVHNNSGQADRMLSLSQARVELSLPGRPPEIFVAPAGDTLETPGWRLFELTVDERCNITVRRVNSYAAEGLDWGEGPKDYCRP